MSHTHTDTHTDTEHYRTDTFKWIDGLEKKGIDIINEVGLSKKTLQECDLDTIMNVRKSIHKHLCLVVFRHECKKMNDYLAVIESLTTLSQLTDYRNEVDKKFNDMISKLDGVLTRNNKKRKRINTPNEYLCPITLEVMVEPVICSDGHTYEKEAITQIMKSKNPCSPITREILKTDVLIPNIAIKKLIQN